MTQSDDTRREKPAPREPVSPLDAAIGRINPSLDLDTVLGEASGDSAGSSRDRHEGGAPARTLTVDDDPRMLRRLPGADGNGRAVQSCRDR